MPRNHRLHILVPLLLFVSTLTVLIGTIEDYGLVWDERCFIDTATSIENWLTQAAHSTSFFTYAALDTFWNHEWRDDLNGEIHPPFFKLSAIAFRYLAGACLFDNIVFQYRVSTAFWTSILVVMLFLVLRRFTRSTAWAILGGLSFIAVPRFFAEAHFFVTDMVVSAIGFSALAVFLFASRPWTRILLGGALFGAALATKFTGILALALVPPMIVIAPDRKRFVRECVLMGLIALAFFSLFDFPVLFNPHKELTRYVTSFLNREKSVPISTLYFGTCYGFRLPFHEPWVMFGITLPEPVVFSALLGVAGCLVRFVRQRDPFSYFVVVPFLILMTVYMLPSTPKHDGIRLFSTAWPFVILLSIAGYRVVQNLWGRTFNVGLVACVAGLGLSVHALHDYHPYQLSYYNHIIGGASGAEKKGFLVSYWYEAFNRDFFQKVMKATGNEHAGVYSYPNIELLRWNQNYGLVPEGLHSVLENKPHKYLLVLNRMLAPEQMGYVEQCVPVVRLATPDGAFIGGLFEVRPIQTE